MRMSIKSNAPELQKGLDALVQKQMPFAISLATNMSIQRSRDEHLRLEYRKFFEMRNKAWFNQVHSIRNSTAQNVRRTGVALAAIQRSSLPSPPGTRKKAVGRAAYSDFMDQHVKGGIKMATGGARNVAIPITGNVTRRKSGAKAGAVNNAQKPKAVMSSGKGDIIESKGKKLLVKYTGRGSKKRTQPLYTLKRAVQIKGGYNPERAVRRGMNQFFAPMMKRAMIRALKTAKLR